MKVEAFVTGPFAENAYLLTDGDSNRAVLIDPGADGPVLLAAVTRAKVTLEAIWLTHAHLDHIGAVAEIRRTHAVPVWLHSADLPLFRNGTRQAAAYGIPFEQPADPDADLKDRQAIAVGKTTFEVMHVPGHAPGHVVFHGHGLAFVGDCLFAGSIGRTDLPLADGAMLERSLASITALPPSTRVFPGHGPETTIGAELRSNPFLTGVARPLSR